MSKEIKPQVKLERDYIIARFVDGTVNFQDSEIEGFEITYNKVMKVTRLVHWRFRGIQERKTVYKSLAYGHSYLVVSSFNESILFDLTNPIVYAQKDVMITL